MQSMLRRRHGFTLVEILIIAPFAMLLIGALIVMATQATNSSLRSYAKTRLQNDVLSALDRMSQDAQLSMHLNYTSDSDAQLKMEAIATSANPLSATRQLIAKSNCAASNAIANFSDVTTYALTYSYNSTNHQLTRTGDFTGKWCGGSQAAQGSSVWQRHNTPEILIQDANVTLVVSNYAQEDTIAQTASSAKVTLTATRVVVGETISYAGEVYLSSVNKMSGVGGDDGGGGGGGTTIAPNTPIQNITQSQCQALPTYIGTNEDAIRSVTDNRGGTTRTYRIAKLADNKCWMLDNLKLGSTTGSITLTSADSNISSNFTLPQVQTGGSSSDDTPTVSGPVPGDTGTGATNYGYLYNWPAATAGETQASMPAGSGNAAHSICARGWRLPTGGTGGDFAQLDQAFGGPGTGSGSGEANIAQWQHSGPFRGVFAGGWWEGFYGQGWNGILWSSSASSGWSGGAFYAAFGADYVLPGGYDVRSSGFGVRCLLN